MFVLHRLCCWRHPGGTIPPSTASRFWKTSAITRRISPKQVHLRICACENVCATTFCWNTPPHLTVLNRLFVWASLSSSGLQFEFINPIFEFSKGMNDLHLDEAEYALLIAINIFSAGQVSSINKEMFGMWFCSPRDERLTAFVCSDRPNVQDHDLVERLQQPYVDLLRSYIMIKRPNVSSS